MDRKAIAKYAVEHHGVFAQEYLSRVGVTPNTAARLVRSGEWQRLHEGVFIGATTPLSPEVRVTAALAAVPSAAIGLRTAAWVHGLSDGFSVLDLVVSVGGRTRLRGATIHQSALPDDDVVCRRGWRTTSLERTLIDLGKSFGWCVRQACRCRSFRRASTGSTAVAPASTSGSRSPA